MAAPALPMGPPPGLGTPTAPPPGLHSQSQVAPHAATPPAPASSATATAGRPYMQYSSRTLLRLSKSPLVQVPSGMPPLSAWFGEWEPYARSQGMHHSPMAARDGAAGYGGYRPRGGIEESAEGQNGYGQRRNREDGRFRRYDDGEAPMRIGDLGKQRFPPSGKNPFGQISASGTFRPAGKDGVIVSAADAGLDKKYPFTGKPGRERDQPSHLAGERGVRGLGERSGAITIGGRDFGGLRGGDRRRPGAEGESNEDGDWEVVQPRSPDSERRLRARGEADNASDWRKGNAAGRLAGAGARLGQSAGRGDARGATSSRTAFPAWMAEDSEPSWMHDDAPSPSTPGASSAPPTAKRGGFDFGSGVIKKSGEGAGAPSGSGARGGSRDELGSSDDAPPRRPQPPPSHHGHIDSIQAFKAEMRERERLQRERNGEASSPVTESRSGLSASRPPPGLSQLSNEQERDEREASPSTAIVGGGGGGAAGSGVFDDFGGRSKESGIRPGGGGGGGEPPGLPGRSSRFARFFGADGKPRDPQAFALAAQQKFAQQSGAAVAQQQQPSTPLGEPSASPTVSNAGAAAKSPDTAQSPGAAAPSLSISELFKGLSASEGEGRAKEGASKDMGSGDSQTSATGGASTPGGGKQPSEADMASMARLMALLGGGGGGAGGKASPGGPAGQSPATQHQQQHGRSTSADLLAQMTGGRPQSQQSQSHQQQHHDQQGPPQWARQSPAPGSDPRHHHQQQQQQGGLLPQSGPSGAPLSPYGEPPRPGAHNRNGSQQSLSMPSPSISQQQHHHAAASPNLQTQQAQGPPSRQGGDGGGGQPQGPQQGGGAPQGLPPQGPIPGLPPGLGIRPDGTFDPYLAAQQAARFGPPPPHLSRMMGPPPPGAMPGPPPNMPPQLAGLLGLARPGGPPPPPGYPMGGSPFGPGPGPMSPMGPPPPPNARGQGPPQSPAPGQQGPGQSGSGGAPRSPLSPQQQTSQSQSQQSQGGAQQQQQQGQGQHGGGGGGGGGGGAGAGGQSGPPPPPGMPPLSSIPPHIQQQLMLIPPHLQGHFLASLATGGPGPGPGGMGGPPPPHAMGQSPGPGGPSAYPPPPGAQSHPFSQGAMMGNAAQLMAMLGGGAGGQRGPGNGSGGGGGQQ